MRPICWHYYVHWEKRDKIRRPMGSRYDGNGMQFGFECCWVRLGDKIRIDLKDVEYGIKSDVVGDLGAAVAWKNKKHKVGSCDKSYE